jgi:UPF0271 protein
MAIGRAIKAVDRRIIYVALSGSMMEKAARALGLALACEGFPDRRYDDHGNLASRTIPGSVLKDPEQATVQALRMAQEGEVVSINGKRVKVKTDTMCVHGDEPTGVAVAAAIRAGLEGAGIAVVPLPEMEL